MQVESALLLIIGGRTPITWLHGIVPLLQAGRMSTRRNQDPKILLLKPNQFAVPVSLELDAIPSWSRFQASYGGCVNSCFQLSLLFSIPVDTSFPGAANTSKLSLDRINVSVRSGSAVGRGEQKWWGLYDCVHCCGFARPKHQSLLSAVILRGEGAIGTSRPFHSLPVFLC